MDDKMGFNRALSCFSCKLFDYEFKTDCGVNRGAPAPCPFYVMRSDSVSAHMGKKPWEQLTDKKKKTMVSQETKIKPPISVDQISRTLICFFHFLQKEVQKKEDELSKVDLSFNDWRSYEHPKQKQINKLKDQIEILKYGIEGIDWVICTLSEYEEKI